MSFTSNRPSIEALTSLRGIAALLLVIHHMGLLMLPLRGTVVAPPLEKAGVIGMTTFFVLSGFVIHYNYADRLVAHRARGVIAFLFARFARLYPLYLPFVLGNYLINMGRAAMRGNSLSASAYTAALPVNLAGMQSWFYSTFNGFNLTIAQELGNNAWSISAELFLYLLFVPFVLYGGFQRHTVRRGLMICVFAMLARAAYTRIAEIDALSHAMSRLLGAAHGVDPSHWLIYYAPYGRFFEFLAGLGLAEIWMARGPAEESVCERRMARIAGAIGLLYIAASFCDGVAWRPIRLFDDYRLYIGYAVAVPLAIYAICRSRRWLGRLSRIAPALFIGEISYSVYLLHGNLWPFFMIHPTGSLAAQWPQMVWHSIAFLALVFVLSWLSWRIIEMPARRRIMTFYRNGMAPAAPQAADPRVADSPSPSGAAGKVK
ncbi:acyltransferase [Caballeronia sp. GAWG1-5s-s]|uniref:acyltransferase family protein n=1 Tax=Caballeronia sp. GAWG1-5s-s TaxID=2921743 RepID=UPI002029715D|nr:acyltransferase [Caballeronia sp. GAWG1-5s-s]